MQSTLSATTSSTAGNWGDLNRKGRAMADLMIQRMIDEANPLHLGSAIKQMIAAGEYGGVEVGFAQRLAQKILHTTIPEEDSSCVSAAKGASAGSSPTSSALVLSGVEPSEDRFVRLPYIVEKTGLSRPTIYRMIASGEFPKPIKEGRTSSWPSSEVDAYISRVKAAR